MIVRHSLPTRGFTRLDRNVFSNPDLTDGAVRLYGYLCGLRNGANFSDTYIMKAMGISKAVLNKRKRELKQCDLILIEQISVRVYVIYIGFSTMPASSVKKRWLMEEEDNVTHIERIVANG